MKAEWELVESHGGGDASTWRMRVHGGWIVRVRWVGPKAGDMAMSICFVRDPLGDWEL